MIEREKLQKNVEAKEDEKAYLAVLANFEVDPNLLHQDVENRHNRLHPVVWCGIGAAFLVNVAILLSLPQVIRGKGAPYLPTFQRNMEAMFSQLKSDPEFRRRLLQSNCNPTFQFVDLGSGDGRLVFRAAREGIFSRCIGYEINPLLHLFAAIRRLMEPRYWSTTNFHCRNIWKVDLRHADVVAVYGLDPIMKDLGVKLQAELKPGSYVMSNVFAIPGWRPLSTSAARTHLYKMPQG